MRQLSFYVTFSRGQTVGNNILKIMFIIGCDSYRNQTKILSCLRKVKILARHRSDFVGVLLGGCIIVFFRKVEMFQNSLLSLGGLVQSQGTVTNCISYFQPGQFGSTNFTRENLTMYGNIFVCKNIKPLEDTVQRYFEIFFRIQKRPYNKELYPSINSIIYQES